MNWVKCSYRLPENEDDVVICYVEGFKPFAGTCRIIHGKPFWITDESYDSSPVDNATHWMPFPEPPVSFNITQGS